MLAQVIITAKDNNSIVSFRKLEVVSQETSSQATFGVPMNVATEKRFFQRSVELLQLNCNLQQTNYLLFPQVISKIPVFRKKREAPF